MCLPSATSSTCPEHEFCSSPSTATRITPTSRTTSSPTRWCTPAPMTMTRLAAGTKRYRTGSGRICGIIWDDPAGEAQEAAWDLIRLAWSSPAALAIAPLQDVLNLGSEARMNVPGRADGNWRWRCTEDMLSGPAFQSLRELTETSHRRSGVARPTASLLEAAS